MSNAYYLEQLRDQVNILINACHEYDKGYFFHAKQMSSIIRVLLKDGSKQTVSLLTSLGVKETIKFYNTAYSAQDPSVLLNLVGAFSHYKQPPAIVEIPIYVPMFDDTGLIDVQWINFKDWWESDVIVCKSDSNNFSLSRKKIVLTMAEQDGGAHVDRFEKIDTVYKGIITNTLNILANTTTDGKITTIQYLQYALVRQIAHEVITTICAVYKGFSSYHPTLKHILKEFPKDTITRPFIFSTVEGGLSKRTDTPFVRPCFQLITPPPGAAYVRLFF